MTKAYSLAVCFLFSFLGIISDVNSQVSFKATVQPDHIGISDVARVVFTISGYTSIEHIYPPPFDEVEIISGPDNFTETKIINGRKEKNFSLGFVIKPKRKGIIKFSPARAVVNGEAILSNEISLTVSSASPTVKLTDDGTDDLVLKINEDPKKRVLENMNLLLKVNSRSVFVGEPVLAEFYLYSRLRSHSRLTKNPSFNGFSVVDIPVPENAENTPEKIGDKLFHVYPIIKEQLYPLQPGIFTIEPIELQNEVEFVRSTYNSTDNIRQLPNDFLEPSEVYTFSLQSNPIDITVNALPDVGRPDNFTGAVGQFHISGSTQKSQLTTEEEGKLRIEITGKGNLQMITAPPVNWPAKLDGFEPRTSDLLNKTTVPVSGKRIFEYAFSASHPGEYIIPPVVFHFFNPESKLYEQTIAGPFSVKVIQAQTLTNIPNVNRPNSTVSYMYWVAIVGGLIGMLMLYVLLRAIRKDHRNEQNLQSSKAVEVETASSLISVDDALKQSMLLIDDENSSIFFRSLKNELWSYFQSYFSGQGEIISSDTLRLKMTEKGLPQNDILEVENILREIEWNLYTPAGNSVQKRELFARVETLINRLNVMRFKQG